MPRYEFMCEKCKKPFEQIMTISEGEKGEVKCPKCKGTKVVPQRCDATASGRRR